jgi:gluconolactonase
MTALATRGAHVPGPPEIFPGRPEAVIDLQTAEGVALVGGRWTYADARIAEIDFVAVGEDLGPGDQPIRTYDVVAGEPRDIAPAETLRRLGAGRVSFNWYRIAITVPERVGDLDPKGCTLVFEVVVDDYAEVWVDGRMPAALGDRGGHVVAGFNAPNRIVLTSDARPGQTFELAVFGINGPISASPRNYIWMRSATLELHAPAPAPPPIERVAGGFEFTEGPVWTPDDALLFSSPNTNAIYRLDPRTRAVTLFRPKSGYAGVDIGRYHQPGSNGLAFDPEGRLTICQHGHRRVLRVNPHGDTTVLADRYDGRRLNSPNDLVYASDGTLYFTDPPFGLPDAAERELPFTGVYRLRGGELTVVTAELNGPNGIALSPDERFLYVGDWDPNHKAIMRYELASGRGELLCDLTDEPGEDAIDGLAVDPLDGTIYACGPGGLWVLSPAGEKLELISLPESPHNLTWGDDDRRALYVTALTSVYRLRRSTP